MARPSNRSILLVEDDEVLRSLLTAVLDAAGFAVTPTRLASEVPDALRATPIDLIVLDLVMPSGTMQGVELLALLRDSDAWRHLPVVILSGYGDVVNRDILTRLGGSAVLTKPLAEVSILPTTIRGILG